MPSIKLISNKSDVWPDREVSSSDDSLEDMIRSVYGGHPGYSIAHVVAGQHLINDRSIKVRVIELLSNTIFVLFKSAAKSGSASRYMDGSVVYGYSATFNFVDVFNEKGPRRVEWSKTAPNWRRASNGLCLEGVCLNQSCQAYKKWVIVNLGFVTAFEINTPESDALILCPMCRSYVDPRVCAFNRCWWRCFGYKKSPNSPVERVDTGIKKADNAYHVFNQEEHGVSDFSKLVIECGLSNKASMSQKIDESFEFYNWVEDKIRELK